MLISILLKSIFIMVFIKFFRCCCVYESISFCAVQANCKNFFVTIFGVSMIEKEFNNRKCFYEGIKTINRRIYTHRNMLV